MSGVPVITIDGPSGSGKGTVARLVAERMGFELLDSGALYRLLAYATLCRGGDPADCEAAVALAGEMDVGFVPGGPTGPPHPLLDGVDVDREIRSEDCGKLASVLAALPDVRTALLARQRAFRRPPGLVADGRDMGTVVFPDAVVKIFLTASVEERARRRYKQLKEKGISGSLVDLFREIEARDRRDVERATAPLRPADDAVVIDATDLSVDAVVERVCQAVEQLGVV